MIPNHRIIGKILVTDLLSSFNGECVAVLSRNFKEYLPVAQPFSLASILDAQVIDEVHLSWIGGMSPPSLQKFYEVVDHVSSSISTPLAVSCRISTITEASKLFSLGADKVIIGSNLFGSSTLLSRISDVYGRQAVVASLDYYVCDNLLLSLSNHKSPILASKLSEVINNLEVGEVSLNAMEYDGNHFPHPIYSLIDISQFRIPVLVSCGYRHHTHISTAFSSSVNGVILSSFLAKSDQSVQQIKARLINDGHRLRLY